MYGLREYKKLNINEQYNLVNKLKYLYLNTNLCQDEIMNQLNITINLYRYLNKENGWKRSSKHEYIVQKRIKKIRYGYENPYQDINRMKRAYQEKLGVDNPGQSKEIKEKIKATNLERYGVEYSIQCEKIKEKAKQTKLERYGNENYNNYEKFKNTIDNKYKNRHWNNLHIPDFIFNKNDFEKYLNEFKIKPTIVDIMNDINIKNLGNCGYTTLLKWINIYKLNDKIAFYKNHYHSQYEDEIYKYLINFVDCKVSINNHKVLNPQELDIYIEKYHVGIEFNGDYWHCDIYKDNLYHQNKSLKAKEKGIFIYHIFEYEWNNERKREIIKSQLRNLCHKNENKVYARNCEIKEIKDNNLIRDFLNKNHLQGYRSSKIKLGLFYNDELVSLMTFGKPYLSKSNKYEWELYRFCNKLNTSVIGGFDKLFKYFIKNYNPQSILTYSDFAKGDGHTYEKMGFDCLELTKPNYVWRNKYEVLSRYQTQMKNENEIMESNGYDKIYDCGNYKWEWNK